MGAFNTAEFAWKDLTATGMGRVFDGISEVEYDVEVEKKHIYGRGKKPRGIQSGNEKPSGSITITQSEAEAMLRAAQAQNPNAKGTDIVFDLQVHYLKGTDLVKDRIKSIEFTKFPKSFKQGDEEMKIKLPFLAMDVQYNVV